MRMKKLLTFLTLLTLFFTTGWAETETFDFAFSNIGTTGWSNSYASHVVNGQIFTIDLANCSKQTTTITDYPVSKGGNITAEFINNNNNYSITGVELQLIQWGSKAQTVTLKTSNDGTNWTTTNNSSNNFSLTATDLSCKKIRFVFSSTSNQVGLKSLKITYTTGGSTVETVATPTFNPAAGTYYDPLSVVINCITNGSTIRYTLDGTDPTATTGTVYTSPISVTSTTTIKAIATATGYDPSSVASATYTIVTPETVTIPYEESFAGTFGDFYKKDVTGTNIWVTNSGYAKASGYISGSNTVSESWLISPYINLTGASNPELSFSHAGNYFNGNMQSDVVVKVKKQGDATWSDLTVNTWPNGTSWTFVENTTSLVDYAGETIQIAFVYTSSASRAGTWEIKNLAVVDTSTPDYYLYGTFNNWNTQDANYKFNLNNGTYSITGVDLPDGVRFKIAKVVNGQVTEIGASNGGNDYGINSGWHNNLPMNGADAYTIESGALTNITLNTTNMTFDVSRDAQFFIKGDMNSWTREALTLGADGWTINKDFSAGQQFGFVNEWGSWYGGNNYWIYQANDMGNPLTIYSNDNFKMVDAGNYNLTVNSALTTLTVTSTAGDTYTLVTSASELNENDSYIIVSKDYESAMGEQGSNNRRGAEVTINGNNAIATDAVEVFSLEGNATDGWYFKATKINTGYLYAASNSSNHLKTEAEPDANGNAKASISIDASSGVASVVFQGTNSHKVMQYNSGSDLFACYSEASQKAVYLYKKGSTTPPSDQVATPSITPGSNDATDPYVVYGGKQQITINCATSGATIYYTTDGTTPTTSSNQYSEPFDLTSTGGNVTIKAIAVKADMDDSEIATSYYRFTSPKAPTFDPATGAVRTEAFDVTISSEYDDAEIYYMLDPASAPTAAIMSTNGTLYENPVNVSGEGSHTIYAMVVRNGIKSSVVNATYTIKSGTQPSGDGDYVKVTNTADLTDGEYLIVYEGDDGPFAFNGALSNLDATPNTIDVEINDFTIPSTPTVDAAVFTFDATAGTFMNASGVYIGRTSDANGLESGTTALTNTVSIDNEGNAVIISEGGAYLRYNANSGQDKFRYFKSSTYSAQQPVALYKKVDNNTVKTPVITPGSMRMTEEFDATITCATEGATIYYTLDGTTPTTNSAVYNGPIHIERPTVTLSAIAVLDGEQSTVATAVYSGVWVYNLAEYNALAKGTENILFKNPVIVQYHYISSSGKSYIYVKDDTGCAYFHQPGGSIAQLENGDVIGAGFSGNKVADEMVSDEESNFFMLTNLANFAANGDKGLADPEHETVARIADATTGVALNNHYITIKKVKLSALYQPSTITYGGAKYFDIDNEAHIGYNKFNIDWSVVDDLDAYYNITGIQTAYNNVMEFHPTEIVKWEESVVTLRQLCDEGVTTEGENEYTISNNLMCVFAKDNSIWVKDDTGQSIWMTSPADGDLNFEVYTEAAEGIPANTRLNQAYYDQSNWCEIKLADGVDASQFEGQIIKGGTIHGEFTDKLNPTLENVTLTSAAISSEGDYAPNYYMPANFLGRQACQNSSHSTDFGQFYFYMTPKPQEYAQIVWAVWDDESKKFIMSTSDNDNGHRFQGEFSIDLSLNTGVTATGAIQPGYGYNFKAIIKKTESKDAGYMVYPLDLDEGIDPATAIESVVAGNGEVKSVKFYNVAGIESATPFQGINIVVTEYTDGTRTTTKMLCR